MTQSSEGQRTQAALKKSQDDLEAANKQIDDTKKQLEDTKKQLDDANKKLQASPQQQAANNNGNPPPPPPPAGILTRLPWLAPAVSAILSLLALAYFLFAQRQAEERLAKEKRTADAIRLDLHEAQIALSSYAAAQSTASQTTANGGAVRNARSGPTPAKPTQASTRSKAVESDPSFGPVNSFTMGARQPFSEAAATSDAKPNVLRPAEPSPHVEDMSRVTDISHRAQPSERESKGIASVAPVSTAPLPDRPDPRKPTGDIVADYNKARTMGDDGGDWFKEAYECFGLSCTNSNDRLLDPTAQLVFQEESRGIFLGVNHKGETRLVPALDKDLEASGAFMQGVFDYPAQVSGPLRLFRSATIEQNGSQWQLRQSGEIKLER